ncbi:MAG: 3-hydroxyacyl-CoA dehydrogenase NAD-binding domain-containing protein, partial [Caulobacterales bacterium]|nr:3-hydroxyacyl-CoA dehydrogenase NAD-binding domain-containing protein [Caulobacterales bacterium]
EAGAAFAGKMLLRAAEKGVVDTADAEAAKARISVVREMAELAPADMAIEAVAEVPDGPPMLFRWRRRAHRVARAEGPERVAPEWWREEDAASRDYFYVETAEGRRFLLFREGLYDRETDTPRWWAQGTG